MGCVTFFGDFGFIGCDILDLEKTASAQFLEKQFCL